MNICLLTDDEKSDIFREKRNYTKKDFIDLAVLASANESYAKTLLSYCADTNNDMDRGVFTDLLNILTWLAEPLSAFFFEIGTWKNVPVFLKQEQGDGKPAAESE